MNIDISKFLNNPSSIKINNQFENVKNIYKVDNIKNFYQCYDQNTIYILLVKDNIMYYLYDTQTNKIKLNNININSYSNMFNINLNIYDIYLFNYKKDNFSFKKNNLKSLKVSREFDTSFLYNNLYIFYTKRNKIFLKKVDKDFNEINFYDKTNSYKELVLYNPIYIGDKLKIKHYALYFNSYKN